MLFLIGQYVIWTEMGRLMTDYWLSTKSPVHMFRHGDYQSPELAKHITENAFVDASILAQETGVCAPCIKAYQRRLGARPITGNP